MYSRSKISLGFSTTGYARYRDREKIRQIHLRDFEAPMSGAFYFVEHQDELEEFYELGREIITYGSREELLEKVKYYLAHASEADHIRQAGYERALRDHTWRRRFDQLFETVWPRSLA
jgi:spore maturation protein CgeB